MNISKNEELSRLFDEENEYTEQCASIAPKVGDIVYNKPGLGWSGTFLAFWEPSEVPEEWVKNPGSFFPRLVVNVEEKEISLESYGRTIQIKEKYVTTSRLRPGYLNSNINGSLRLLGVNI